MGEGSRNARIEGGSVYPVAGGLSDSQYLETQMKTCLDS
jgi:hypothetical protein